MAHTQCFLWVILSHLLPAISLYLFFGADTVAVTIQVHHHNSKDSIIKKQTPEITFLSPNYLSVSSRDYHYDDYAENNNSVTNPLLRGIIPGLYVSQQTGFYDELLYFIKKINGVDYFNIPSTDDAASAVWINLEEW